MNNFNDIRCEIVEENMVFNNSGNSFNKSHDIKLNGYRGNGKKVTMEFSVVWSNNRTATLQNIKNKDLYMLRRNPIGNLILYTKNDRTSLIDCKVLMVY